MKCSICHSEMYLGNICPKCSLGQDTGMAINIIFDGPPGPEGGRFVEVETDDGKSIDAGKWIKRADGLWALRIVSLPNSQAGSSGTDRA